MAAASNLVIRLSMTGAAYVRSMLQSITGALGSVTAKIAATAKYAAIGGLVAFGGASGVAAHQIVSLGVKMEQTSIAFQTMLGSVRAGNQILAQLNDFANVTPFSNEEVIQSGKTLLAFGVEAKDVQNILTSVGDVSAGSGKALTELSAIYGKVFAKGKADSEALNQMTEASIPIIKVLGQMYGKSGDEIYDMASKGQIMASDISAAFSVMTGKGGVFADMMQKQSQTAGGMWSTVMGNLSKHLTDLGTQLLPFFKSVIAKIGTVVDMIGKAVADGRAVKYIAQAGVIAVSVAGGIIKGLARLCAYGKATAETIYQAFIIAWHGLKIAGLNLVYSVVYGFMYLVSKVEVAAATIARLFSIAWSGIKVGAASLISYIVTSFISGINVVIKSLNSIPGVNIGLVGKPEFLKAVDEMGDEAAKQLKGDVKALSTGSDATAAEARLQERLSPLAETREAVEADSGAKIFSAVEEMKSSWQDASKTVDMVSATVDSTVSEVSDMLTGLVGRKAEQTGKADGEKTAGALATKKTMEPVSSEGLLSKTSADSLSKIGLYNYRGNISGQLDRERNSLLKKIAGAVDSIRDKNSPELIPI